VGSKRSHTFAEGTRQIKRLYILGDLFSFWAERLVLMRRLYGLVLGKLAELVRAGCPVSVLDGNRDFGYGRVPSEVTGAEPLGESAIIEQCGEKALLLHGDQLATSDRRCQIYMVVIRSFPIRCVARWLPEQVLARIVRKTEEISRKEKADKPDEIMEPDLAEAARLMCSVGAHILICGHAHRPSQRSLDLPGPPGRLFILGTWDEYGGTILEWPHDGDPRLAHWPRG
jgi:UDP-2,3-diacylglucosamine hydrolase